MKLLFHEILLSVHVLEHPDVDKSGTSENGNHKSFLRINRTAAHPPLCKIIDDKIVFPADRYDLIREKYDAKRYACTYQRIIRILIIRRKTAYDNSICIFPFYSRLLIGVHDIRNDLGLDHVFICQYCNIITINVPCINPSIILVLAQTGSFYNHSPRPSLSEGGNCQKRHSDDFDSFVSA